MLLARLVVGMLAFGSMLLATGVTSGQDYPNKPIRIVAGAVGGNGDFDVRQIAPEISAAFGQPVIVDNRPVIVATETVAKASPDGYTLLVGGNSFWTGPLLQKLSYDMVRDFSPIAQIERTVNIVAVHPSIPAKSIKELIALAKARPGELNYSSATPGGASHLAGELFKYMAGVNMVWVPYKGNAQAITALLSGEVQVTINDASQVAPHVKSGRLRALAVTSAEPSVLTPGLPTVAASGLPGYEMTTMQGVFAPAKTPGAFINRLNQEIVRVLNRTDMKERFLSNGEEIVGSSPEQFASAVNADIGRISKVIKEANIKIE